MGGSYRIQTDCVTYDTIVGVVHITTVALANTCVGRSRDRCVGTHYQMIFEHRFFRALTDTEPFVVGFLDRSILVDIVQAQIEFIVVLFTTAYADTVIMHKGRMRNLVHPIGGNITIDKGQVDGNAPHCVQLLLIVVPFRT